MSALPAHTHDIPYADHVRDEHDADDMRALAARERADDHDPTPFARPPAFLIPPACRCSEAHHLHGATTAAASALPLGRGGHTFQPNPLNEALAAMTAMTVAANEHRARKAGLT